MQLHSFKNEKEEKIIRAILQELYGKDTLQLLEKNDKSGLKRRNELRKEILKCKGC